MRIHEQFLQLKQKNEKALIVYYTAGFPTLDDFQKNVQSIADSGADIIEIGIPFSDPVADGPVIQKSSHLALENGITLHKIINLLPDLNLIIPVVLMSYLNPLLAYGPENLVKDGASAGVSGLIIPDLPVEESTKWQVMCGRSGIDLIQLFAPTTKDQRRKTILEASQGFVYCVSIAGTTGVRDGVSNDIIHMLNDIKKETEKPVAVGFGVSTPDDVRKLSTVADGVIVGSRVIKAVLENESLSDVVSSLKAATKES